MESGHKPPLVGNHAIQLFQPFTPLRSEDRKAVCNRILQFNVVGIYVHALARHSFAFCGQLEQKLLRRRVYSAHKLYAAPSRPAGGVLKRASVRPQRVKARLEPKIKSGIVVIGSKASNGNRVRPNDQVSWGR